MRINSVVSRNLASLPGSVPMALAILAAGPSNLVVLGGTFLLCEEEEEEPEEWWDLEEGVELVLVKKKAFVIFGITCKSKENITQCNCKE